MATTPTAVSPLPPGVDPADPFRYGWRYVAQSLVDGNLWQERVPLTLEDVLHPQEGDFRVQNDPHLRWCVYLYNAFRILLARVAGAVVLSDCLIVWDVAPPLRHGPDIAVIFGVRERKPWGAFRVADEGVQPALIVEITSPETAHLDRSAKVEEYEAVGVPFYIIVDPRRYRGKLTARLIGYALTDDGYQPLVPDERGRLWLPPIGCWLGIAQNELVCYDAAGVPILDSPELADALQAEAQARREAEEQASAAEARADSAEARVRELEAELRRLHGA